MGEWIKKKRKPSKQGLPGRRYGKTPIVILDPDSLNKGNKIPEGSIIITAPEKKKPAKRMGKPSAGMRRFNRGGKV